MGNVINAVTNAQKAEQTNTMKRLAITLAPGAAAGGIFAKELINGKNIYEAGNEVKKNFNSVHEANKESLKENLKTASENIDKCPIAFGLVGQGIKFLNSLVN